MKKKKSKKKNKHPFRSWLTKFLVIIVLLFGGLISCFILLIKVGVFGELPNNDQLANIKNNLSTEIISADGNVIGKFFLQERTKISINDISPNVINALVATEDARFFEHNGIDYRSLIRVLIKTVILQDRSGGGGSTITQQLIKNLFPREHFGILSIPVAKTKEIILALRMEKLFSKEELLVLYLNTVPFGDNVYGISAASKRFFNKKTIQLQEHEAAVLIGMLKANYTYNPRIFPEKSLSRRNLVLRQMNKYGYLKDDLLHEKQKEPLSLDYQSKAQRQESGSYYKEQIRNEVLSWIKTYRKPDGTTYNIYTDGLRIYTTIDSRIQKYAVDAMSSHLKELQRSFANHWKNENPWDDDPSIINSPLKKLSVYRKLKKAGLSENEILDSLRQPRKMEVFSWDGTIEKQLSTIDSLSYYLSMLQTGVIAMDPQNGQIKAWIGGNDFDYFEFDHAKESTKRQVGSTFKPIVYATALESEFKPCDYVSAARTVYEDFEGWTPNNSDSTENLKKYSYKGALASSVNTVTVKVLEETGLNEVINTARNLGITSALPAVPSIALGTPSISLLEMTRAYSVFANGGDLRKSGLIMSIEDAEGNVLVEFESEEPETALSTETSALITDMLREVIDHGTGGRIRWKYELKNELAGKTGTTQSNADGWFVGYNPKLVIGVWVGADDPRIRFRTTSLGSGSNMALPIFAKIFQEINKDQSLSEISQATFDELPASLAKLLDCENEKEDKSFIKNLLGKENKEKINKKKFGEEKQSFLDKVGSLFRNKKKKKN
ncbi:MAG: transglycosylase domain-containing protein [Reichenbachiella sp.]